MYYTVYKITNRANDKIYVGVHKTSDLNDSYLGSGKMLKRAIAKHGADNFTKEYLAIFDNPDDMFKMEAELVNAEFVKSSDSYNMKEGGNGGWDHISNESILKSGKLGAAAIKRRFQDDPQFLNATIQKTLNTKARKTAEEKRKTIEKTLATKSLNNDFGFTGKTHSASTRLKMKQTRIDRGLNLPERHSQFGSMWITNGISNKKISKTNEMPSGFHKGRTI